MKTRQQSKQGFLRAGGFKNIYRGLSMVALGSAPGSMLFFATYELMKTTVGKKDGELAQMIP